MQSRPFILTLIVLLTLAYMFALAISTAHLAQVYDLFAGNLPYSISLGLAAALEIVAFLFSIITTSLKEKGGPWAAWASTMALMLVWFGNGYAMYLAAPEQPIIITSLFSCFVPICTLFVGKVLGQMFSLLEDLSQQQAATLKAERLAVEQQQRNAQLEQRESSERERQQTQTARSPEQAAPIRTYTPRAAANMNAVAGQQTKLGESTAAALASIFSEEAPKEPQAPSIQEITAVAQETTAMTLPSPEGESRIQPEGTRPEEGINEQIPAPVQRQLQHEVINASEETVTQASEIKSESPKVSAPEFSEADERSGRNEQRIRAALTRRGALNEDQLVSITNIREDTLLRQLSKLYNGGVLKKNGDLWSLKDP